MTHVDLFSGIGGFALAARANSIETVQFVEVDKRCRDFLSKAWPGVAIHDDIRTFNETGHTDTYLLTAGVPCQPASRAGKQRGEADDRWLWPEALRVLREVAPDWCLFENPPGIGDLEFDRILSDVEAQGYEVEVLSIPACAVNAPHRRERYWIVGKRLADAAPVRLGKAESRTPGEQRHSAECNEGHMADAGCIKSGQDEPERGSQGRTADRRACAGNVADAAEARRKERAAGKDGLPNDTQQTDAWDDYVWLPCADGKVRRAPDDTFGLVDGLHRSLLGALGNSIVWQVAARVIAAMVEVDKRATAQGGG